jgi:hypothetical protein
MGPLDNRLGVCFDFATVRTKLRPWVQVPAQARTVLQRSLNMPTPDLERIIERLNDLQRRGVIGLYAIGGAFAFIFYAEPIATRDLDVFAEFPATRGLIMLDKLYEELHRLGYEAEGDAVLIEGFPVQFLPAPTPLVQEALAEARTVEVGKQKSRVFTAEHAVAIALQTNRAKDRLKIEHLLESGRKPLDEGRLTAILKAYALEDRWKKFLETRR